MGRISLLTILIVAVLSISCSAPDPIVTAPQPNDRHTNGIWLGPQVVLGVNKNQFIAAYPNANFEALMWVALDFGVTFYGDNIYAPKWTGSGLSFADPDKIVPGLLAHPLANELYFWFPISSFSVDKLQPTYNHWKSKGWLNKGKWFVFMAPAADEPRTPEEIMANNQAYLQFKGTYPEIEWVVTREATNMDEPYLKVLADIYLPMFHWWEIENLWHGVYGGSTEQEYANAVARGGYISGSMADPTSFEPDYYANKCKQLGADPPPFVPTFGNGGSLMMPTYCQQEGMQFFLFWNILDLLTPDPWGNPVPNQAAWEFLNGM